MRDLDDSTLWRISAWERMRQQTGDSGFARLEQGATVLPTTMVADLARLEQAERSTDPLEVIAACLRHKENALILLRHQDLLWPLSVFPMAGLYHLPRSILETLSGGVRDLQVVSVEPPGLKPPGHEQWDRIGEQAAYRPLAPLLWALAMHMPQANLLGDIAGRAAYRASAGYEPTAEALAGALGPAVQRLRHEVSALADIAAWPGMTRERAIRLLNGIYLQGGLMVLRTHHAARESDRPRGSLLGWMRRGR